MPDLPKVEVKKNNFLQNLKKEYQTLSSEFKMHKIIHLNRLSHQ